MIPPKHFDIFPPCVGCPEGLDAFRFFFQQQQLTSLLLLINPFPVTHNTNLHVTFTVYEIHDTYFYVS